MSYLVIQIGKCGNKLGHTFFSTLADITSNKRSTKNYEFLDKSESRFFSYNENEDKKCARAILLDTDPWLIESITKPSKDSWCYGSDCYKFLKPGKLSSWPIGYKSHGPIFKDFILDAVRKEIECCDQFYGFLLFGSICEPDSCGLSSYITELLRTNFPNVSIAYVSVWPLQYQIGYTGKYSAILNLSALQSFSDAVFVLDSNYYLMKLCMKKMNMENPDEKEFNSVASYHLANLLLPVDNYCSLNDMLSLLVPHPQFKLISLRSVPQEPFSSLPYSTYDWSTLFRSLRRVLLHSTDVDRVSSKTNHTLPNNSSPVTLTNLLLLRGKDCESADINYLHKPQFPYTSWVPKSSRLNVWTHPSPFLSCDRTALLANNGQLSLKMVDERFQNVWQCFKRKYFFHVLEQEGLTEEELLLAYLDVEQIISSYKSLKA